MTLLLSRRSGTAWRRCKGAGSCALICLATAIAGGQAAQPAPLLDVKHMAEAAYGADAPWYVENIPFVEIDDKEIQQTYFYRWEVYRSHLREIGGQGTDETEFLTDVPWARHPYTDLNDSSSFHIMEGRWLRHPRYLRSLVNHLYAGGGDDRHFSESVAAATWAWVQVTGDPQPALRNLEAMKYVYNAWDDHFDRERGLYWIEPLLDATEYTISSIDASGAGFTDKPSADQNRNGFTGGYAYRPSINAYQFANAEAIAELAELAGQPAAAADYRARAKRLQEAFLAQLWNPGLEHFTDRYQRSTPTVAAGSFIRGRELVGYVPWEFGIVPQTAQGGPDYGKAWQHVFRPAELAGRYGVRTVEPSYPKYMQQYRYDAATGRPECQWNGPAWPFQTSQMLTGMANLLQDPAQRAVTREEYVLLLRQYTALQRLADGTLDVEEDYDPDRGTPIVGLPRSHHYNHSTYNDLVLSGLIGIRPRMDDVLEINPLLPGTAPGATPVRYFAVDRLRYHGRDLQVVYDADGQRYHRGAGLSVFAGGRRIFGPAALGRVMIPLAKVPQDRAAEDVAPVDVAVNVEERAPSAFETELPIASASSTAPGSDPYQAIDGRLWFFPQIVNGWSPAAGDGELWFAVDLRHAQRVGSVDLAFAGEGQLKAPVSVTVEALQAGQWRRIDGQVCDPAVPLAGGITHVRFPVQTMQQVRVRLQVKAGAPLRLIEMEAFGPAQAER